MIGSHDSFSFLKAENPIFNLFSSFWRTQTLNIKEQYNVGVRYFDIRVRETDGQWQICHGLVDFVNSKYRDLETIVKGLHTLYKDIRIRLILERGNEGRFIEEINSISNLLSFAAIKKNWKVLINKDPKIIDCTYVPWHSGWSFFKNVKHFLSNISTIKCYAKKHRPQSMEPDTIYFMDYVE